MLSGLCVSMPRYTYLGIVSWVQFLCDGCNIVQKELVPFSFKAYLVHVDINSWDIFIASLYSTVLKMNHENTHEDGHLGLPRMKSTCFW